jgi:tetratricopeptide (TPR) repeat protein
LSDEEGLSKENMRFYLQISVIAIASCFTAYANAGPLHLYPDKEAAAKMPLDEVYAILQGNSNPVVLNFNNDGPNVVKGGTVADGSCILTKDFDLKAQGHPPSQPDLYGVWIASTDYCWTRNFWMADAQKVLNALQRWRMTTPAERREWREAKAKEKAAQAAEFAATIAANYRAANPRPVISEDVRRYKVIAEANVRAKRFTEAVNGYMAGLQIAPWWPEGQFNAALMFGTLGLYPEAIEHMNKYLALVPDAPNARAAQDKIYVWESGNN